MGSGSVERGGHVLAVGVRLLPWRQLHMRVNLMKRKPRPSCPTESQEMEMLARYLDAKGYTWCHVPNEGLRNPRTGARLKRQGMKAGVPDVLIFDRMVVRDGEIHMDKRPLAYSGLAIELKRKIGGFVSLNQARWAVALRFCGWAVYVCGGFDEARLVIESFEREKRP